ncbi:hypothetical protein [Nocardia sp. NBC_00403]|uniref:hypothetical protein n=1 Tax=Nocardia sp. NBC_00403 TaxID=2975990 RepID=UPI002E1F4462
MISRILIDMMAALRDHTRTLITKGGGAAARETSELAEMSGGVGHTIGSSDSDISYSFESSDFEPNHDSITQPKPSVPIFGIPTPGRDLIEDLDYRQLYSEKIGRNGDMALAEIYRRQGFDGPAELTDAEGIAGLESTGRTRLLRGVSDARHVEEFKFGPLFPGTGGFGHGTYATTDPQRAMQYAHYDPDQVIEMVLHPDARIVDYERLHNEQQQALSQINDELNRLHKMERTPEEEARIEELKEKSFILKDRGRFAAAKGYDAYLVPEATADHYEEWVILNRTALIIQE